MIIYFSEKFKNLRKTRALTQEQVADMFHVSPQAVSRWETGTTYPDIELLPSMADFFKVTIEDLLGVDIAKKETRIEEIIKKMCNAIERQNTDENAIDDEIEIVRNGLQEFPNNLYLLDRLAGSFWNKICVCKRDGKENDMKKYAEEAIKIFEKLINESNNYTTMPIFENKYGCNYERVRYGAIQGLSYTYHVIGETDRAIEWAKKLPNIDCTDQMVLSRILQDEKSEKRAEQIKWNIFTYSAALKAELDFFSKCEHNDTNITDKLSRFKEAVEEINEFVKKDVWHIK